MTKNLWYEWGGVVILTLILIGLVGITLIVIIDNAKMEQADRLYQCQRQGYADVVRFADEYYCVRVADGLLVGVRLDDINTDDATREPGAHSIVRWE